MYEFLHLRDYFGPRDFVRVRTDKQCNVRFLTDSEFSNYRSGRHCRYDGALVTTTVFDIAPTTPGTWNAVVDTIGFQDSVRAELVAIKQA